MREHPNAIRSKDWLLEALAAIMEEKAFQDISVKEIAGKAQLDRRTFYRHFKSREEILAYGIRKGVDTYHLLRESQENFGMREIALMFFTVCEGQKEFLLLLHKQKLNYLVLNELERIFPEFHFRYHSAREREMPYFDSGYRLSYHVGGFWNVMNHWLEHGAELSVAELTDIVVTMFAVPVI